MVLEFSICSTLLYSMLGGKWVVDGEVVVVFV